MNEVVPTHTQYSSVDERHVEVNLTHHKPGLTLITPRVLGVPIISILTVNESGTWYPMFRPHLRTRRYSWYSFLSVAESATETLCGRKNYVNKKFQCPPPIWNRTRDLPACNADTLIDKIY